MPLLKFCSMFDVKLEANFLPVYATVIVIFPGSGCFNRDLIDVIM